MSRLNIQVWSDIACPWCYVGKRRIEAAIEAFGKPVEMTWRAFELDPSAPKVIDTSISYAERLAKKYGSSMAQAEGMIHRMTETAKADNLDFRFDIIKPGNTFVAHRLLHLALERGIQDAVKERFLLGYMSEGKAIGDKATLSELATQAGLDADEVASLLASDTYAREVRADQNEARALGITGVPFFLIGRYGVSGAQPAAALLEVLNRAWAELPVMVETEAAEGTVCGPEGCD